ncbi:polypyrimidine tract-binding protein 1 [Actinidia rufa]|uniref:Polypyrimidine tract-binding protein 1 n=1 Tax=Actinidia rufa TaxID=165716 RepID=A0A7J0EEJ1_9ERIC|nr:polypyrimidine tract-binding protein 1 [Actinidia rufa]
MQPTVGPDGKKKEPDSNVLLASIENMQYAVTVDVLHTVFSAFGTVQKIAIFEKNGGTQALIQYPDVTTAAVAKDALEGHCIYDGGYCKLHLSYSRHTDLNVKAYCDKSRDYTIPVAATVWQNPQAASVFPPGMGQTYAPSSIPAYAAAATHAGSSPFNQTGQIGPNAPSMGTSQSSHQPNVRPGGAWAPGQPHYYG